MSQGKCYRDFLWFAGVVHVGFGFTVLDCSDPATLFMFVPTSPVELPLPFSESETKVSLTACSSESYCSRQSILPMSCEVL